MTISFNTIPSNTLVPLFYAEMDNSAANTAQDSGASLLIGHANNGAEIVANSLLLMPSADYARQICGAGSQLARMVEAYRQTDPFGELYVIAVPESTGAAATVTLTVTGAATETGTVNVYVGRTRVQAPVTNGDNVTTIASSIQDAINAVPALPFTASSSAGVVTLTARHKGLCGNEIPVSLNYYGFGGGEVLPAGVQIAVAAGTAGTGAPVLTGAVAAMADEPFDYIGLPFNDTASVNTLVADSEFQRPTLAENISMLRNDLFARLDVSDTLRRMDEDVRAKVYAAALHTVYGYIDYLAMNMLPDLCDESWLARHAAMKRCPRKGATAASGYMRWEGVSDGLKVIAGSVIQRDDLVQYTATADATSSGGVLRAGLGVTTGKTVLTRAELILLRGFRVYTMHGLLRIFKNYVGMRRAEFVKHALDNGVAPDTQCGITGIATCHPGGVGGGWHVDLPVIPPFRRIHCVSTGR